MFRKRNSETIQIYYGWGVDKKLVAEFPADGYVLVMSTGGVLTVRSTATGATALCLDRWTSAVDNSIVKDSLVNLEV